MAASSSIIGKGVAFSYISTPPSTYTDIGEVLGVDSPNIKVDEVEFTHSTSDSGHKEFKPGWKEAGEVKVKLAYVKAQVTTLIGTLLGTEKSYKITLPDASTWTFSGFLKDFAMPIPIDGRIEIDITIRITGAPTWTAGS